MFTADNADDLPDRAMVASLSGLEFMQHMAAGKIARPPISGLLNYTLDTVDWSFLEQLGLQVQKSTQIEKLGPQLMAFAHATRALTMLPQLPASQVSHPTSAHYRDLRLPRRPGEWLELIEELEDALTRLQEIDVFGFRRPALSPLVLRRTHAYFDASAWMVRAHLRAFGMS